MVHVALYLLIYIPIVLVTSYLMGTFVWSTVEGLSFKDPESITTTKHSCFFKLFSSEYKYIIIYIATPRQNTGVTVTGI